MADSKLENHVFLDFESSVEDFDDVVLENNLPDGESADDAFDYPKWTGIKECELTKLEF